MQHPDDGVVTSIAVKEGAQVSAGDILMTLDSSRHLSELAILEGLLFELIARRGRLEAERENHTTIAFDPLLHMAAAGDIRLHSPMQGQIRLLKARNASLGQQNAQLGQRRS